MVDGNANSYTADMTVCPSSRIIPPAAVFHDQTVRKIEGLLVGTGVFNPRAAKKKDKSDHSHRDFDVDEELPIPTRYVDDIDCAITYALDKERYVPLCD